MILARTLASTLLCAVAAGPLMAAEGGIRAVTLSSGGLAEITRTQTVDDDGVIRLDAPAAQIDDVLKSLIVRDPAGAVAAVTLDGPEQAEETFGRMPFTAEDLASPARLVGALQGVRIRVESGGRTVEGRALGVSERNAGEASGTVRTVSVLTDAGTVEALPLGDGAAVSILDDDVAAKLATAASAAGKMRVGGARTFEIRVTGRGRREVALSYVVAAPVWKTAYRALDGEDGKLRLQAWAVLENVTGEDWKDVSMTLSSGAPVTLTQRLHQRYWRDRPEVPVAVEGVAAPPAVDMREMAAAGPPGEPFSGDAAPAPAPQRLQQQRRVRASPAAEAAEVSEGDVSARYALPGKIDLAAGRTMSVPIADIEATSERVSLFNADSGRHPVAALVVANGSKVTLPPGVVTVYDAEAGYVGDARLPSTPPGETRMASFALDRKVEVRSEAQPESRLLNVKVANGVATTSVVDRRRTTYTIKGAPDAPRTVIVEHRRRPGWSFRSDQLSSETADAYRLKTTAPAGATVEVKAEEETTRSRSYRLATATSALLLQWSSAAADPADADKLAALGKAQAALVVAKKELADIDAAAARVRTEQERIRSNLAAVPADGALARSYLDRIAAQERELSTSETQRVTTEEKVRSLETATGEIIGSF